MTLVFRKAVDKLLQLVLMAANLVHMLVGSIHTK